MIEIWVLNSVQNERTYLLITILTACEICIERSQGHKNFDFIGLVRFSSYSNFYFRFLILTCNLGHFLLFLKATFLLKKSFYSRLEAYATK